MLKSLEIKNFRVLEDFTVSKLGRVNLIVGKNNSGKSSILEALQIYAGNGNPDLLREIAGMHDELPQTNETDIGFAETLPFESFFPGRKFPADEAPITIGEIGSTTSLQIRYGQRISKEITSTDDDGQPTTRLVRRLLDKNDDASLFDEITPVLVVSKGNQNVFTASLFRPRMMPRRLDPTQPSLPYAFVPTRFVSFDELANIWDKVGLTEAKAVVFDALRICDRLFFEACCRHAKLQDIEVGPPITLGAASNGKGNAIALLPKLIDQMKLETVTHLALVVDADSTKTGGLGFIKTWDKITGELHKNDYHIPQRPNKPDGGICFEHKDGYPPVGLWIMPDNCSNGFLEDFIKMSLAGVEKPFIDWLRKVFTR